MIYWWHILSDLKERFLQLYRRDLESDKWLLIAFYGDPDVIRLNDLLNDRWMNAGMSGEPLDYASDEELKLLLKKANRYVKVDPKRVMSAWMFNGHLPRGGGNNAFIEMLRRLFFGGTRL